MEETPEVQGQDRAGLTRRRLAVASVVLGLILVGVAAVVAAFALNRGDDPAVAMTARFVDPRTAPRAVPSEVECPDGRGPSPLTDTDHDRGVLEVLTGFGEGQLAVITVAVAVPSDGEAGSLAYDTTLSTAFPEGVVCAFVDTTDPAAVEQAAGADATASWTQVGDTTGALAIDGVGAGETVVVELWLPIAGEADNDRIGVGVALTPMDDTDSAGAELAFTTSFAAEGDDVLEVAVEDLAASAEVGQRIGGTVTLTNVSDTEVLNRATAAGTIGGGGVLERLTPVSSSGPDPECTFGADTWTCELGFVEPGETISLELAVTVARLEPPEGIGTAGSPCSGRTPKVCIRAEATYLGGFAEERVATEAASVVTTRDIFLVIVDAEDGTRIGDSALLQIFVALGTTDVEARDPIVTTSLCGTGNARYEAGDAGNDQILGPDELWRLSCRADDIETAITETVVEAEVEREDVVETFVSELDIGDPRLEVTEAASVEGSAWDLANVGNEELSNVDVNADACVPTYVEGDLDGDEVLDPGEVWRFACEVPDAVLVSWFATDTSGEAVGGAVDARPADG